MSWWNFANAFSQSNLFWIFHWRTMTITLLNEFRVNFNFDFLNFFLKKFSFFIWSLLLWLDYYKRHAVSFGTSYLYNSPWQRPLRSPKRALEQNEIEKKNKIKIFVAHKFPMISLLPKALLKLIFVKKTISQFCFKLKPSKPNIDKEISQERALYFQYCEQLNWWKIGCARSFL